MQTQMYGDLIAGQVNLPIAQIARGCPHFFGNHFGEQLLVVTLASSREDLGVKVSDLIKLARVRTVATSVGSSVLVPPFGIEAVLRGLTHGDELYVVPGNWSPQELELKSFLPDRHSFASGTPSEFIDSFRKIEAVRFFADGLGTNFCIPSMSDAHDLHNAEMTMAGRWP